MFDHQALQNAYGNLLDLSKLLHGPAHLPQQEPDQKVIPAEVIGQGVVELQVYEEEVCKSASDLIQNMFTHHESLRCVRVIQS